MTFIPWNSLENPVYGLEYASVKDACMIYYNDTFYLYFSAFYEDRGRIRSHVLSVKTNDWQSFSKPFLCLDGQEDGWTGLCSPNISQYGDRLYLTFNSWGDKHPNGRTNNLFYITSDDGVTWTEMRQVAPNLTEEIRAIDLALAESKNKYYVVWKDRHKTWLWRKDRPRIAVASDLDSDFSYINDGIMKFFLRGGEESKKTHENFQFLQIDGIWHLITTDYVPHRTFLYRISGAGSGENDTDWLKWVDGHELVVPSESFNTRHRSNAGFLADWRVYDGYFYLLYAGNTEGRSYARRGDNTLGLARSKDLDAFKSPPQEKQRLI